jgi:hypothetical protein
MFSPASAPPAEAPRPARPVPAGPGASALRRIVGRLRGVHLAAGLLLLVVFLGTGQYMDRVHDHLRGMDDATRLLFRSSHIYLLWSGLLNLALGLYLEPRPGRAAQGAQLVGSALILASAALLVGAFFVEPLGAGLARPLTRPAVYAVFAGGLHHLLAGCLHARG